MLGNGILGTVTQNVILLSVVIMIVPNGKFHHAGCHNTDDCNNQEGLTEGEGPVQLTSLLRWLVL